MKRIHLRLVSCCTHPVVACTRAFVCIFFYQCPDIPRYPRESRSQFEKNSRRLIDAMRLRERRWLKIMNRDSRYRYCREKYMKMFRLFSSVYICMKCRSKNVVWTNISGIKTDKEIIVFSVHSVLIFCIVSERFNRFFNCCKSSALGFSPSEKTVLTRYFPFTIAVH